MLKLNRNSKVDFDKYLSRLSYMGSIYYNLDKISYPLSRAVLLRNSLSDYIYRFLLESSGGAVMGINRDSIFNYLINTCKVPKSLLESKKNDGDGVYYTLSIDAKHLEAVRDKGFAVEFIDIWLKYTSLKTQISLIEGIIKRRDPSNIKKNLHGQTLFGIGHEINYSEAYRTYYKNFSHQQVPKAYLTSLDAPAGYTMVKGDFEQSDLKIVYNMLLKDKSNVDIMFRHQDSYEGVARLVEGDSFDLDVFKENRALYKQNTLSPVYGGTSATTKQAQDVIDRVNSYLSTLDVYQEFKKRIERKIECKLPVVVNTYFGNSIEISNTKNHKQLMDAALNAPGQAGTSEVVVMCANSIMDKFAEYGITQENGGIYLYLNRHDELVFLVKNEFLEYSWIFQDHEDIIVEGWMPLKISFSFSDNYAIDNDEVDKLAKSYYRELEPINVDKLIQDSLSTEYFIPCEDTKIYYIGTHSEDGRTCIVFLNEDLNVEMAREVNTENKDIVLSSIINIIGQNHIELRENNYTSACVFTTLVMDEVSAMKGIPIIMKSSFSDKIYMTCQNEAKLRFRREE